MCGSGRNERTRATHGASLWPMAEQDVDIAALSDDEVVDLTVDGDDWDDVEVGLHHFDCLSCGRDIAQEAAAAAGFQRS